MDSFNNVLLFGGRIKKENMPMGFYASLAMVNLRGKPVVWWALDNLKKQGLDSVILVIDRTNVGLVEYAENVLKRTFSVQVVKVNSNRSILNSLRSALKYSDDKIPTRVILGDTFLQHSINDDIDVVYTSKNFVTSANWCLLDFGSDDVVLNYYDKIKDLEVQNKEVVVGYYAFSNTKVLRRSCFINSFLFKKNISDVLKYYQKIIPLKKKSIIDWLDLGHSAGLVSAKKALFNFRDFNSISVDPLLGTLTKSSSKIQKLEDEYLWYNALPRELQVLVPRTFSFQKNDEIAHLVMELYGYPSLQELYLSGEVNIEDWQVILRKLFEIHNKLENTVSDSDSESLIWLYWGKTKERLDQLELQSDYWKHCIDLEKLSINGASYLGLKTLLPLIKEKALTLAALPNFTIMHGDYCFSNILFDSSNYVFKFIDPRGRLNGEASIFGDARYDIAKLRHSVVGLYDFIVQDLFRLFDVDDVYIYSIFAKEEYKNLEFAFDHQAETFGFSSSDIKFIEGLLFLSMIPLHKDNFKRQKMFYLKSIVIFNETLLPGGTCGR